MNNKERGNHGENIAVKFLKNIGYEIIARNYWLKFGEIDIIAIDNEYVVFVEVKTRVNDNYGMPIEAVGLIKQKTIRKVGEYFWLTQGYKEKQPRFDIIEVLEYENIKYAVRHNKNAF